MSEHVRVWQRRTAPGRPFGRDAADDARTAGAKKGMQARALGRHFVKSAHLARKGIKARALGCAQMVRGALGRGEALLCVI